MKLLGFTDGGYRRSAKLAALGGVLCTEDGCVVRELRKAQRNITSNQAEYLALIHTMNLALSIGCEELICHTDSLLMVNQVKGLWDAIEPKLAVLADQIRKLRNRFVSFDLLYIPREKNTYADRLVNLAMDEELGLFNSWSDNNDNRKQAGVPLQFRDAGVDCGTVGT